MPLDRDTKAALRDKVSLANKSNVADIIAQVEEARAALAPDDQDHGRLGGWLDDLHAISAGGVIGRG